ARAQAWKNAGYAGKRAAYGRGQRVSTAGLVPVLRPQLVAAALEPVEHARNARVVDRLISLVRQQILLADISDVARFRIFSEQVIEGLILGRPDRLRDRFIPFVAVGEDRVDIEDHAAKVEQSVAHDLADRKTGLGHV